MTSDETSAAPSVSEGSEFRQVGPRVAFGLEGDSVQANLSAIGKVRARSFSGTGSAIGVASVDGDATVTASMTPAVICRGDAMLQQSYVSAMIVSGGGNTKVHQAASPLIVGKTVDLAQSAGGVVVTGSADVKSSWVGVVLSPKTVVSEDSRVIVSTKAALIIAAALFGGLGLVALAIALGVRRAMRWRPHVSLPNMPDLSGLQHNLAALQERFGHLRHTE